MKSRAITQYIYFGTGLRYLQDAREGHRVHGKAYILDNVDVFFDYLEKFDLPVTQRASYELRQFRNELAESDPEHELTADEASKLSKTVTQVRETLMAEAGGNVAFIVTEKRIDVSKLLSNVRGLMAPDVFDSLRHRKKPPPAALLDNLDNIRRSFRNPTQHPDKIYDIQEAQDLFHLCVDVVNRMAPLLRRECGVHCVSFATLT